MVTGRNFDRVAWTVTAVMIALTILFMNGTSIGLESVSKGLGYEARIFDKTRVHTIDIVMNDWDSFIENAASETYTSANVVIDGEVFKSVGIRGKGNTSLSNVSQMGSQRYSLKLEFDHYDKTKTYYGLDKLALNNLIQDSTMMKDYLTYTMMYEFGVHTPLCSFVYLTVNGEDWGLYLAVEAVEDAFLRRNYGTDYGELYKPDSTGFGGGRGNGREFRMSEFWNENFASKESETDETESSSAATPAQSFGQGGFDPSQMGGGGMPQLPDGFDPSQMGGGGMPQPPDGFAPSQMGGSEMSQPPEGFDPSQMDGDSEGSGENSGKRSRRSPGGGFGMGSSDVKLQYTDDELDSYSNIWNNAKTDINTNDQMRLIQSLKKLSSYEDIDSVVDIDQVIRYFVVHNYVCNGDSYTGAMIHNYYLHEKDGQLAMIPWDYNLAFGTFQGSDATGTVNTPIDSPASGSMEDRPMLNWIFENEEYTELYHQYFSEFLESVDITGIIDAAYELIAPYVEKDPTAFYTYEDFEKGSDTLRKFCELRTESIQKQLETGETVDVMDYADASGINLSDMGSMGGNGGGGFGGFNARPAGGPDGGFSGNDSRGPEGRSMPGGSAAENGGVDQTPVPNQSPAVPADAQNNAAPAVDGTPNAMPGTPERPDFGMGGQNMPDGGMPFEMGSSYLVQNMKPILIWSGISVLVLVSGIFIAKKFRY